MPPAGPALQGRLRSAARAVPAATRPSTHAFEKTPENQNQNPTHQQRLPQHAVFLQRHQRARRSRPPSVLLRASTGARSWRPRCSRTARRSRAPRSPAAPACPGSTACSGSCAAVRPCCTRARARAGQAAPACTRWQRSAAAHAWATALTLKLPYTRLHTYKQQSAAAHAWHQLTGPPPELPRQCWRTGECSVKTGFGFTSAGSDGGSCGGGSGGGGGGDDRRHDRRDAGGRLARKGAPHAPAGATAVGAPAGAGSWEDQSVGCSLALRGSDAQVRPPQPRAIVRSASSASCWAAPGQLCHECC